MSASSFRRFKVFSTKKVTMQVSDSTEEQPKKFWLVESDAKSSLNIRPLDEETWLPSGRPVPITVRELQRRYTAEPGLYEKMVHPSLLRVTDNKTVLEEQPDLVVRDEELPPVDEEAVTKSFQKGLSLLEQGDLDKATLVFNDLINSDTPFEEEHKHLFNDFAIQLRKSNQPAQAIAFYTKAIELSWGNEDENLHINLARVLYSEKQYGGCVQHLFDALRIAPGHKVARSFLTFLEQQKVVPKQYQLQVRGYLMQRPPQPGEEGQDTVSSDA